MDLPKAKKERPKSGPSEDKIANDTLDVCATVLFTLGVPLLLLHVRFQLPDAHVAF